MVKRIWRKVKKRQDKTRWGWAESWKEKVKIKSEGWFEHTKNNGRAFILFGVYRKTKWTTLKPRNSFTSKAIFFSSFLSIIKPFSQLRISYYYFYGQHCVNNNSNNKYEAVIVFLACIYKPNKRIRIIFNNGLNGLISWPKCGTNFKLFFVGFETENVFQTFFRV